MNKAYPQFNLKILQLPAPASSMTKAEYKEAYGIDLDSIDIEKVTLLQMPDRKNKYFVDGVKVTENGFDIYAGGNILSIGSSVSLTENVYNVVNSKPLYWHSLTLKRVEDGLKYYFDFVIISNEKTEFTLSSFASWLENNKTAQIKVVQAFFSTASNFVSYFKYSAPGILNVYVVSTTTGNVSSSGVYFSEESGTVLEDTVNALN